MKQREVWFSGFVLFRVFESTCDESTTKVHAKHFLIYKIYTCVSVSRILEKRGVWLFQLWSWSDAGFFGCISNVLTCSMGRSVCTL